MRKFLFATTTLLSVMLLVASNRASAQTYTFGCATCTPAVPATFVNGANITTCAGFFYDNSPGAGEYLNNQNYTVTFTPATAGRKMRLDFTEMAISSGDSLEVFDGTSVAATRLMVFNPSNNFPLAVTATLGNTTNALTVRFRSDASSTAPGWRATVKCVFPCQPILGAITINGTALDANGYIGVCRNTALLLAANVTYPQSGQTGGYTQTNALSRFVWTFGGYGNDTAATGLASVTRTITQPSGYYTSVVVTDTNGCSSTLQAKVEGSVKPILTAIGGNICFGDTSTITASYTKVPGFFVKPPFQGKTNILLADHVGTVNQCNQSYLDTIFINSFTAGTTLNMNTASDFVSVTVNMEHSFMGDVDLQLISPNNTIIELKPFIYPNGLASSGNGTDLGEPIPGDGVTPVPGKGYSYRFTPQATVSMIQASAPDGTLAPTHTYTGTDGFSYTATYLPAGDYAPRKEAPATPFSRLNGSPVNGNWVLKYCDNYTSDNGVIFWWKLDFASSLPTSTGAPEQYTLGVKDARWMPATGLISSVTTGNTSVGKVFPPVPLVYNYFYRVTDSANCIYDTVVKVFANPKPVKSTFTGDTVICRNTSTTLTIANVQSNTTYTWYDNPNGTGTPLTTGITYTTPVLTADRIFYLRVNNLANCLKLDTVSVRVLQPIGIPVVASVTPGLDSLKFTWAAVPTAIGYLVSLDSGRTYITPSSGSTGLFHVVKGLHPFETRTLWVIAKGPRTCQDSDPGKATGTTLLDELYVPNAFTPNGDGKNDIWMPYGWLIKELSMKIFNQWGEMIYSSTDPAKGWDGRVNGKAQPVGVYIYVMKVVDQNGRMLDKKGSINLVR